MEKLAVLVHNTIRIGKDIYFDPYAIRVKTSKARLIFVTHSHYDHLSEDDLRKIITPETKVVCPIDCVPTLNKLGVEINKIVIVVPNQTLTVCGIKVKTIPAYNLTKHFHPIDKGWVSYIINIDGIKYAVLGDTDMNEDNQKIKCDVLFVPIGGKFTMDLKEAAELTNIIKPKLAIPTHYGEIIGDKSFGKEYASLVDKSIKTKVFIK